MKKILLALATVLVSTGVMAQGTFTFKSYLGSAANVVFVANDGSALTGWYATLLPSGAIDTSPALQGGPPPLSGTPVDISVPLTWSAAKSFGYANGGDWAIQGLGGGSSAQFAIGLSLGPWSTGGMKQVFAIPGSVVLGDPAGNPPTNPGAWAFTAASAVTVAVPEPSVIALGVLGGLGVFMLRRRS